MTFSSRNGTLLPDKYRTLTNQASVTAGNESFSISVSEGTGSDGSRQAILKISGDSFEITIWIPAQDTRLFEQVRTTRWDQRGSLCIGNTAQAPVFWSCDEETLSILVGADDETWDIGFALPLSTLDSIIAAIKPLQAWLFHSP